MDRSGIYAQSGFSFQMALFMRQVAKLNPGETVCYEYLDDISTVNNMDPMYGQINVSGISLIQVKNTRISRQDVVKLYTNWILAYSENDKIAAFTLYSSEKKVSDYFHTITVDEFISDLRAMANNSVKSNAALLMESKDRGKIEQYFSFVKEHAHQRNFNRLDIEADIGESLSTPFHRTSNDTVFDDRVIEFKKMLMYEVSSSMLETVPYTIGYESYMQICEDICSRISKNRFEPSYSSWVATLDSNLLQERQSSREYQQLLCCCDQTSFVNNHLYYCEYYRSLQFERLARSQAFIVADLEGVTFDNYSDSCLELKANGTDNPVSRLVETKNKSNQYAFNEHEKWGSCIWLTREDTPVEKRISWKDE